MLLTVREIARRLGADFRGEGERSIVRVAPLDSAAGDAISFASGAAFRGELRGTRAGAVLLGADLLRECPVTAIVVDDPYLAYARVATLLHPRARPEGGVHPSAVLAAGVEPGEGAAIAPHAVVESGARIGARVVIGAGCYVGEDVSIGDDCWLHANVSVYARCTLGERVEIHSGAVIGSDGFGFANDDGRWVKIPQLGAVRVGDDCEIGAGTTIDCGAMDDTVLEEGVVLDNQIQVAHNVRIGAHTAIAGCVGIAGSTKIGRHCRIGGGAGIVGHLEIVDHVHIGAMSLVTRSIAEPGSYASGTPLEPSRAWRRNYARFKQLDSLARRVGELEKDRIKPDDQE